MLVNAKNAKEQLFCHYILVTAIALTIKRTVYFSLFSFFFFHLVRDLLLSVLLTSIICIYFLIFFFLVLS